MTTAVPSEEPVPLPELLPGMVPALGERTREEDQCVTSLCGVGFDEQLAVSNINQSTRPGVAFEMLIPVTK